MSATHEPGTVAMVTNGDEQLLALRVSWPDEDWMSVDDGSLHAVSDVRPLAVLDPDDRKQVERLLRLLPDEWNLAGFLDECPATLAESLDAIAAALRHFASSPKPPEPQGLGAVVEDSEGVLWTRCSRVPGHPWQDADDNHFGTAYEAIDVVRVLSEGVQP